jgi:hypothetical protein
MSKVDYKAVLEDLKLQRVELDKMIAFVEGMLGAGRRFGEAPNTSSDVEILDDTFTGKNILQATEKYLRMVGRPARSTEEIATALTKGGLNAAAGSVATILGREKGSKVHRVKRGLWGLAEWYSNHEDE